MTLTGVLVMLIEPVLKPQTSRKPLGIVAILGTLAASLPVCINCSPRRNGIFRHRAVGCLQRLLSSGHWRHRSGDAADLTRLFRRTHQLCRRILRADSFWRDRHDADDLLRRTADGLHQPGDFFHLHLHSGRVSQTQRDQPRSLHQILFAGIVCHRIFSLRHRALLWRDRLDQHLRDCERRRRRSIAAAADESPSA